VQACTARFHIIYGRSSTLTLIRDVDDLIVTLRRASTGKHLCGDASHGLRMADADDA